MTFDPSAAALPDSGIYGLPSTPEDARVVVVPVPFAATTSYGGGAERGPAAILEASKQVDLFDLDIGRVYEPGIAMLPISEKILAWHAEARRDAEKVIALGGSVEGNDDAARALSRVNALSEAVNDDSYATVRGLLAMNKLVAVVGGDHSAPFGAIRAIAEHHPGVGILHVDAHADLRDSYEGFTYSHASIMHNVATRISHVATIVQVGVRDLSEDELQFIQRSRGRVKTTFDADIAAREFEEREWTWQSECARIVGELPPKVYVSFDIDGLDPTLCPHTGTPVPGGLSFQRAMYLVGAVARSGRTIVGVDLNEVVPGEDEWDANVGARVLYKMIGWMLASNGAIAPRKATR
jgi:agmatinase